MTDTYVNAERPVRRKSYNWLWLLILPLFFALGWVANDMMVESQNYQAEPGVGGAPYVEEPGESSPTLMPKPTVTESGEITTTPDPSVSPSDTTSDDDSNDME